MSNLLKYGTTITKSERIIDYNDVIKDKLQAIMQAQETDRTDDDGFVSGLDADVVETIPPEEFEEAATQEEMTLDYENAQNEAARIINDAQAEADEILSQAGREAEKLKSDAKEEGYAEGLANAQTKLDEEKHRLESEYEQKEQNLADEYEERKKMLEPQLVDSLLEIFEKVTHTVAEDNKEIILHLINDVMKNADSSHEFTIKVSPDDYEFVAGNQGKIYCAMSNEVTIDIVQDITLKKNECIIETDSGVFDCSLDVELNNLIKDIKLLSCT